MTVISQPGVPCCEDCRGDFGEISQLMERSWAENSGQALFYSPEYLASCFTYPGASLSLAPTIYNGSTPVAFAAAFPRRVVLRGRELNVAIITFLTAANEYKKRGYGIVVWTELVRRLRVAGFDGMVNYGTEGETMNGLIPKCCRMLTLPTAHLGTIPWWSRIIQPRRPDTVQSTASEDIVDRFLELTQTTEHMPLARTWNREEADWQCRRRHGVLVAQLEAASRRGMIVGYVMQIANSTRTKCLIVEDVFWGNLVEEECETLVKILLDQAAHAGAQLAIVPQLGYAELKPFNVARFRPSRRIQHVYLTVWNGERFTDALPSIYLDVF